MTSLACVSAAHHCHNPTAQNHKGQLQTAKLLPPPEWDVFISHAFEDKEAIARPLALSLREAGLKVWYDEFTLSIGDNLTRSIDYGLSKSKFGVVIISAHFLAKQWPQKELAALAAREDGTAKVVLPIWHGISAEEIKSRSPLLADRIAVSSDIGVPEITRRLLQAMNLPFKGLDIEGIWHGDTGRLRLFRAGELVQGDYDWLGRDWVGHITGQYKDRVLRFNWHWDLTAEKGNGYFEYYPAIHSLNGGWAMDYDRVDVFRSDPHELRTRVHEWVFVRHET